MSVGLGDDVREGLLHRVGLGRNRGFDHKAGGGNSDRHSLSVCDMHCLGHGVGYGHRVDDCGRHELKSPKIKTAENFVSDAKAYLCVGNGEILSLDGHVGDGHCLRGRTVLSGTPDQISDVDERELVDHTRKGESGWEGGLTVYRNHRHNHC